MKHKKSSLFALFLALLLVITTGCSITRINKEPDNTQAQQGEQQSPLDAYVGEWQAVGQSLDGARYEGGYQLSVEENGSFAVIDTKSNTRLMSGTLSAGDGEVKLRCPGGSFEALAGWDGIQREDTVSVQFPANQSMVWSYGGVGILFVRNTEATEALQTMMEDETWYSTDRKWQITNKNGSLQLGVAGSKTAVSLACISVQNSVYTFAAELHGGEPLPDLFGEAAEGITTLNAKIQQINDEIVLSQGDNTVTFDKSVYGVDSDSVLNDLCQRFWIVTVKDLEYDLYFEMNEQKKLTVNVLRNSSEHYAAVLANATVDEAKHTITLSYVKPDNDSSEDYNFWESLSEKTSAKYALNGDTLILTLSSGDRYVLKEQM